MCYKHICTDVSLIILAYMSILYFAAFFTSMKIENTHRTSSTKEAIVGVLQHVLKIWTNIAKCGLLFHVFGLSPRLDFPLKTMHSDLVQLVR